MERHRRVLAIRAMPQKTCRSSVSQKQNNVCMREVRSLGLEDPGVLPSL